jgi:hypothetical protein
MNRSEKRKEYTEILRKYERELMQKLKSVKDGEKSKDKK